MARTRAKEKARCRVCIGLADAEASKRSSVKLSISFDIRVSSFFCCLEEQSLESRCRFSALDHSGVGPCGEPFDLIQQRARCVFQNEFSLIFDRDQFRSEERRVGKECISDWEQ